MEWTSEWIFLVFFHLFFLLPLSSAADDLSEHVAIQCHTHYKSRYFLHIAKSSGTYGCYCNRWWFYVNKFSGFINRKVLMDWLICYKTNCDWLTHSTRLYIHQEWVAIPSIVSYRIVSYRIVSFREEVKSWSIKLKNSDTTCDTAKNATHQCNILRQYFSL